MARRGARWRMPERGSQPLPAQAPSVACARVAGIDPYDPAAAAPHELVSFGGSFHGRTLGALALTAKDQYKTPFSPLTPGALMVPYCDLEAAARVIQRVRRWPSSTRCAFGGGRTCALMSNKCHAAWQRSPHPALHLDITSLLDPKP